MLKKIFHKRQALVPLDKFDWVLLAAGVAVFSVICLLTIGRSSIWFDEAFGAYLIRFDFWQIAGYTAADVHPPLYYWALKAWGVLFGTTEIGLRSMSVFFMAVAIVFGFLLAKKLFGRKAAWLSLLFMVLSPMLIRYSQEMRMYAMVTAIAFAATYVMVLAMESKKRSQWILYGILVGLGMWTHYFTAPIWLSHWAWRAWIVRGESGKLSKNIRAFFSKDWILAHVVAVGVFLPWIPALIHQLLDVQINGFWIPPVTPDTIPNFLTNALYYQDITQVTSWFALTFMLILIGTIYLAARQFKVLKTADKRAYGLIFALAFLPMILLFVASMPPLRSSFVDRYLVASTLGIALFMGVTIALSGKMLKPKWQKVSIALIAGVMFVGIYHVYTLGNYNKTLHSSNNTRQIVEQVAAQAPAGQPIIADSPWLFYEAAFYSSTKHPVYFIDEKTEYRYGSLNMLKYSDLHKIKDIGAFTRDNPIVWYIGRPGEGELTAPYSHWQPLKQIEVNDSVSGKPAYKALQFQTR